MTALHVILAYLHGVSRLSIVNIDHAIVIALVD